MHDTFHTAANVSQGSGSRSDPFRFRVVIAGAGFAGVYCAKTLGRLLGKSGAQDVALISERNYMEFQPMLPEVCGSELSPRHVVNPIRRLCHNVTVLRGRITGIDLSSHCLTLDAGAFTTCVKVKFEHLAFCLGSVVDLRQVPGMPEHAFLMQNVGDALELRGTLIDRFEEAALLSDGPEIRRLLTFVVVGGGYSGTETAGQIADLVRDVGFLYPRIDRNDVKVILIHAGNHLLPEISERLGRYAEKRLRERGVEVLLETRVKAMTASKLYLADGGIIETHTVISTIGTAPNPFIAQFSEANAIPIRKGRIIVEQTLRVQGTLADRSMRNLWAAGDCASVPLPNGKSAPPTAQFAMRQGKLLGRNLAAALASRPLDSFNYKGLGELANIGRHAAVADILGFQFSGFLAWWLWRTIYLAKLPGIERKLRVMIDWTLDLFFPRDISLLRPIPSEIVQEVHLEAGDYVFHAGEPAFSFYIVRCGCVEVRDGESRVVRRLENGEHFGERALLEDRIWRYSAIAVEPTELVSLPAQAFDRLQASRAFRELMEDSRAKYWAR